MKSLTYSASLEVSYQCYKILEHFTSSSLWYCLCDKYQGCLRGPYPVAGKDCCCVCTTHNSFELEKFYLNILRDLAEILSVDPDIYFWKGKVFYKHKNCKKGQRAIRV